MATRTTISLPDELKARMDMVAGEVNWSAEAAKCFDRLLGEIAARKPNKDMSDVIARLKASKIASEDESYKHGHTAGRYWAEHVASYPELERARKFNTDTLSGGWSDARGVACEILGVDAGEGADDDVQEWVERFWDKALPEGLRAVEETLGDGFLEGFIHGASDVWAEVADEL